MKLSEDILIKIAIIYCNEGTPLSRLAKEYGVGKTTLVRYFKGEGSFSLPKDLQKQVDEMKKQNYIEGKSTSGNKGNTIISKEQARGLALMMVKDGLTLRELCYDGGPTSVTIANSFTEENLGKELYSKVQEQYRNNKKKAFDRGAGKK